MIGSPFLFSALLIWALSSGCGDGKTPAASTPNPTVPDSTVIPYNLNQPDAAFALPPELLEISGLATIDSTRLAAVQDERGVIYVLDRETAQILSEGRFRGNGDYEGIEVVDDFAWMLRSDGFLYSAEEIVQPDTESARYDLDLHANCDAEGLALDERAHRLLIVCKENPGRGLGRSRAIYAFDLLTLRRFEAPVYLIDRQQLDVHGNLFKPSALAIHPRSGYVYVLSSVRKMLIVIDPDHPGQIREMRALPERLFPQPEGLTFFPDGTLFIANEGVNGPATLLRFDEQIAR